MPLLSVSSGENATPSGFIDREEGNDNFEPEMDEAEFLESIGLCKDNFPSIEEQSIQAMRSQLRTVDQRPQSTIVIKGNDTYAFFNFLINSEYLIAKSGSYQGIPPTLLSPVAFEGGTLRAAKMVQGQVKKQKNGKMEKVYNLDISGYILPAQVYSICKLLKNTQGRFNSTFVSSTISSALNTGPREEQYHLDDILDHSNFGLSEEELNYFRFGCNLSKNQRIGALEVEDCGTDWTLK